MRQTIIEKASILASSAPQNGSPISLDDIITSLGVGPWNALYFVVAALSPMSEVVNLVGSEFTAPPISFTCVDPPNDSPPNSNECYVQTYVNVSEAGPTNVSCKSFLYDNSTYVSTLTSEFNLVCSRDWYREGFQLLFTLGCIVGSPLGGMLADRYGRQPPVFYGSLAVALLTVLMTTVPVLYVMLAARFLIGIFTTILVTPAYTIGLEVFPLKHRATYGVTVALPYALMLSMLAGIAWLSRKWRLVQLWGSVPTLLLVICSNPFILKESPRWLVSQGRLQKAEEVLRKAASLNNTTYILPDDLPETLHRIHTAHSRPDSEGSTIPENLSFWDRIRSLVSTSTMRRITIITVIVWLFQSTLYISIPLRATNFLSPFAYMAVLGVAEIPAYTITAPITSKTGRKPFVAGALLLTAIMEGTLVILMFFGEGDAWSSIAVSAVAYTFVCSVFQVNLMYCSELFPTSVRTLGTSIAFFMSSAGFNIPPLLDALLPKTLPWLPLVIYSGLAVCAAALVLLLPETNKRPLMQSVQEHINYTDEKNKRTAEH